MSLEGKRIRDTYKGIAILNDTNSNLSTSFQTLKDGSGNESPLKLAIDKVGIGDLTLPTTDGTTGQVLATDGLGQMYWEDSTIIDWVNFDKSIIPDVDQLRDLGSPERAFRHVYVGPGSLYVNGNRVITDDSNTLVVSTSDNQNLSIKTGGTGNLELAAEGTGSLTFKSDVIIQSGFGLYSTGAHIDIGDDLSMNSKRIMDLAAPINSNDAARKADVDAITLAYVPVNKAGDSMSGALDMGNNVISNIAEPISGTDAANKNYVDNTVAGFAWKNSVKAATLANVTLNSNMIVDGVSVAEGDRVLVKNQTNAAQNGIYIVRGSTGWDRAEDADNEPGAEIGGGTAVFVEQGNQNEGTAWVVTSPAGAANLGTDPITFTQFAGSGTYTAGDGLTIDGNEFRVASNVVRTTGDQTISGKKTFTDSTTIGSGILYIDRYNDTDYSYLRFNGDSEPNRASIYHNRGQNTLVITVVSADSPSYYKFDGITTSAVSNESVLTRMKADDRYLKLIDFTASNLTEGTLPVSALTGSYEMNAATATTIETPRTIGITGAITGTPTAFDGSMNIAIPVTDINADNISSGTMPDARLSNNVVKTTGNQTIAGQKTFNDRLFSKSEIRIDSTFAPLLLNSTTVDQDHSMVILSLGEVNADFNISFRNSAGDNITDTPYKIARTGAYAVRHDFKVNNIAAAQIVSAGTDINNSPLAIITAEKGDARYARLSTSNLFTGIGSQTAPTLAFENKTGGAMGFYSVPGNVGVNDILRASVNGLAAFDIYPAGTAAPTERTAMSREKSDARYARLNALNSFSENITVSGEWAKITLDASLYPSTDPTIQMIAADGTWSIHNDNSSGNTLEYRWDNIAKFRLEPNGNVAGTSDFIISNGLGEGISFNNSTQSVAIRRLGTDVITCNVSGVNVNSPLRVQSGLIFSTINSDNWDGIWYDDAAYGGCNGTIHLLADAPNPVDSAPTTQPGTGGACVIGGNFYSRLGYRPVADNYGSVGHASLRFTEVHAVNGTIQTSDINFKENIQESDLGLDFIKSIEPVSYSYKDGDTKKRYGFIAQQVKEHLPEGEYNLWRESENNTGEKIQQIAYQEFISPLVKAVQEQQAIIETLQQTVQSLQMEIQNLKGN